MDGRDEGARDLILAIFRLAVADYRGISYGHDECDRVRRTAGRRRSAAEAFLVSWWAAYLADSIGISSATIWSEAHRLHQQDQAHQPSAVAA